MRKTWIIAAREYKAAVRTKAFVIGLLLMPIMMGGSIVVQMLVKNLRDTTDKQFVVIDRTKDGKLATAIEDAVKKYNEKEIYDTETGKQIKPALKVTTEEAKDADSQRVELSEKVRKGELVGFLDIGPYVEFPAPAVALHIQLLDLTGVLDPSSKKKEEEKLLVRYQTNRPTFTDFQTKAMEVINNEVRDKRVRLTRLDGPLVEAITAPVRLDQRGLTKYDEAKKEAVDTPDASKFGSVVIPMALLMLMFMVVLMGATPMMQSVVEEKMQRIAEVLLGSVSPFQLMMGKLIGMTGVSLTIAAVYLGGGYAAAVYHGYGEHLTPGLIVLFLLFQTLACLMFGSLFAAVGAACSDMKETQNLMWPVMLLAVLPMFLIGTVLQEPNGPVATSMSFFPFATPTLMVARQAIPPGLPWWQPVVGVLGVLATTVACVWVASRIFRVGILMQGKGANLREMARWVFRG